MKFHYFRIINVAIIVLVLLSCARRGRPTGGPKDEAPPIMVVAKPAFETINFKSQTIEIEFDEYIKLSNIGKQLIVSPPLKYKPVITPLGTASKVISIELLDTLKLETTYIFNFGTSVKDNNEGNILYNFKYVMSTGNYIDSLKLNGKIQDAISNKVDKDVAILLYRIEEDINDSIIYNSLPNYIANTLDSVGWEITNIKAGRYLLAAMKQKDYDYKFKPKTDKIAFYPHFINIPSDSIYDLTLFKEILDYKLTRPSEVSKQHIVFGYEGVVKDLKIDLLTKVSSNFKSTIAFDIKADTLHYWFSQKDLDSLQFKVSHENFVDTITVKLRAKQFDSIIVGSKIRGSINLKEDFKLLSNQPIIKLDPSKVELIDRDTIIIPYKTEISKYKTELVFKFDKEPATGYILTLLPGALTTFYETTKDTIRYRFSTRKLIDYGSIFLTFNKVKSYPVIVELLDSRGKVVQSKYVEKAEEINFSLLKPSKYLIRAIYDENKNKIWDTGSFLNKFQPEKVIYFPKEIDVKANWIFTESFDLTE